MIGFFRKIRRNLANQNKFVQYSRYAIGEIVLVIIGILIALQINNWNENRKLDNSIQIYYQQLLVDLQADKNYSKNVIYWLENSDSLYNNYIEIYKEPNLAISKVFEGILNNTFSVIPVQFRTSTIKTLINTGRIELINPVLRTKLTTYNGNCLTAVNSVSANNNDALNLLQSATLTGVIGGFSIGLQNQPEFRLQNQPELMKVLDIENKHPDMLIKLEAYLNWKNTTEKNTVRTLNYLIKEADIIIEQINKELKK